MSPIPLVLALLLAADDPADLAARVVAGGPGAEAAAGQIEEIGRPALPALRSALDRVGGQGEGTRVADLIDLIERRRLLRASPLAIEAADLPLAEALAAIGRQAGFRPVLDPAEREYWESQRVSLAPRAGIGFWEALDALGAAGGFRPELGPAYWATGPATSAEPAVRIARLAEPSGRAFVSRAGPYRVELTRIDRHRQATQARPGQVPLVRDEFTATIVLAPEPGLEIDRNGSPRVVEAVDDRGVDLRPASTFDPSPQRANMFRQWRPEASGALTFRVPLAIPASPGGTLKAFRGDLPITAMARTGPLMDLKLDGPQGRPVSAAGVTLSVERVERSGGRISILHVLIRGEPMPSATPNQGLVPSVSPGPRGLTLGRLRPNYHADDHFQVLDDTGRPLMIFSNLTMPPRPDGSFEARIQFHTVTPFGPPTTARYFGIVAEAVEVPFAFEGVPLP